jgi:hypothetical protein
MRRTSAPHRSESRWTLVSRRRLAASTVWPCWIVTLINDILPLMIPRKAGHHILDGILCGLFSASPIGLPISCVPAQASFNHLIRPRQQRRRDREPRALAVLTLITRENFVGRWMGRRRIGTAPEGRGRTR